MSDEFAPPVETPPTEETTTTAFNDLVNADGTFAENWASHLTGDYQAAAGTAGRYKSLPELAKAVYHGQQQLSSRDDRVTVPNGSASPEEVAKYRAAIGIPASVEEYKLERPEGVAEENWDIGLARTFAQLFHENNVPPAAAQALVAKHAEIEMMREQSRAASMEAIRQQGLEALKAKFGADMTKQLDFARRMAITAGVDPNDDAFGNPAVVEALAYAGRNMREDFMVQSTEGGGGQSTSAALADKIMTDKSHPEYEKFWADDPATRQKVSALLGAGKGRIL